MEIFALQGFSHVALKKMARRQQITGKKSFILPYTAKKAATLQMIKEPPQTSVGERLSLGVFKIFNRTTKTAPSEKMPKPYVAISCRNRSLHKRIISEFYIL